MKVDFPVNMADNFNYRRGATGYFKKFNHETKRWEKGKKSGKNIYLVLLKVSEKN